MEFFFEVAVFAGKVFVLLGFLGLLMLVVGLARSEHKKKDKEKTLELEDLSETLQNYCLKAQSIIDSPKAVKQTIKQLKKDKKINTKKKSHVFVLQFKGDIKAKQVDLLREEVSILMKVARPKTDEIVIKLNNTGGLVHSHGLGASQLQRLRDHGFSVTVCVDQIAASGGYLMACLAHKILAAPFSIIGSIGVLMQLPNFHRLLEKQDIDYEEHHAGEHKRTITMFGKTTEEKRKKLQEQLDSIHNQFKNYVLKYRPNLDLSKVATGEYWHGEQAQKLGLVDEIMTSDDYILSLMEDNKKVYGLTLKDKEPKGIQKWLSKKVSQLFGFSFLKQKAQKLLPDLF